MGQGGLSLIHIFFTLDILAASNNNVIYIIVGVVLGSIVLVAVLVVCCRASFGKNRRYVKQFVKHGLAYLLFYSVQGPYTEMSITV